MNELMQAAVGAVISLPLAVGSRALSLAQTIAQRRSCRRFAPEPLTLEQLGQLLWAAQGVTSERGFRAAPSAGACYPLELYAVLPSGVFWYLAPSHALTKTAAADRRSRLVQAALGQRFVGEAAAVLALIGVYERTTGRYGERGRRYVHLDAGCAAENVHLQAEALNLGSVAVGAFDDDAVAAVLGLTGGEQPLYLIPVGRPAGRG